MRDAEKADKFIEDYKGSVSDLMNARELKPQFDAIVKNWSKISNESVVRIKEFIRAYATENNVTLPADFKVTSDMSASNPTLVIKDSVGQRDIKIFNS